MNRFKSIVLATVVALGAAVCVIPVQPASAASSAALSIVPKKNYTIEPGKTIKDTLVIRNLDRSEPLSLTLRVIDFTFTDDGGTPKLFLDKNAPQTTWSLKPFLTVPKTVKIPPKTSKTVNMSVAIPKDHGGGSYYSAIVYSSGDPTDGGNVGLNASGVTLVFAQVAGDASESLKLERFGAYYSGANGNKEGYVFFAGSEPEMMAYTLKNSGNVTQSPVGSITIRDMFGRERTISEINPNNSLALIDQTRTFTACIKTTEQEVNLNGASTKTKTCTSDGLWPGIYSAKLDIFYGWNGNKTQELSGTALFIYMPWWAIIILIAVIVFLVYHVRKIVLAIRSKTARARRPKNTRRR
jgi:hypothetical protein